MPGRPEAKRRNAVRGALVNWCPNCKRKNAIRHSDETCRYCGHKPAEWHKGRRKLLVAWVLENPKERDPDEMIVYWKTVPVPRDRNPVANRL